MGCSAEQSRRRAARFLIDRTRLLTPESQVFRIGFEVAAKRIDVEPAAPLLKDCLADVPFRLVTNNPENVDDLSRFGLEGTARVKHVSGVGDNNRRYLNAKLDWGHKLSADGLNSDQE